MFLIPQVPDVPTKYIDTTLSNYDVAAEPNAPFINERFLDDLRSATNKATHNFAQNLTMDKIDSSLANDAEMNGQDFSDGERNALKSVKDNFVDFERLDSGGMSGGVSKADIDLFGSLYKTTGRDIYFYDDARKFMVENKSRLDHDGDGVLSLEEIQNGKVNPSFSNQELQIIDYLSDRYSNKPRYSHYSKELLVRHATVPESDFEDGGLNSIIDRSQTTLFEQRTRGWVDALSLMTGLGVGTLAAIKGDFKVLTGAALIYTLGITATLAARPLATRIASSAQNAQEDRIHRLMTTVGDLKY